MHRDLVTQIVERSGGVSHPDIKIRGNNFYNFDAARELDRFEQRAFPEARKVKNDHSIWRRRKNPFRCDAKSVMDIHELRAIEERGRS